nr:PREDICTED: probable cytochrome P450 6a20 [Bemisia tabaci]XP_018904208.1 PREDICTED: probable cytochrome P450 6a20 [Bemisia tabaci]
MAFQLLLLSVGVAVLGFLSHLVVRYWRNYTAWSKSGIPYIPFPRDCVFYPIHKSLTLQKFYNELAPNPVGGFYKMSRPVLLVRDPELARRILITDFSQFKIHDKEVNEELDPMSAFIFNFEGERWKTLRQKLNPIFSAAKLKGMWSQMMECQEELTRYLDRLIAEGREFEVRGVMKKFALDVIGTCGFGLNCGAIQDEESEFRKIMDGIIKESNVFFFRSLLHSMGLGWVLALLEVKRLGDKTVEDFFFNLVRECVKFRAESGNSRNDLMQHLINLQHEEQESLKQSNSNAKPLMTDAVVAANTFEFFIDGFETSAGTLAFIFYELALNPEVMDKCREEVKATLAKHGGNLSYDSLKDLTYIQCVIDEALRKYPAIGRMERVSKDAYELSDISFTMKKNTMINIPVYAFHHDPKYFPNPHRFDPDRFSEENKHNILPGTYLPFGDGPRMCMGLRFAFMEMKAAIASLVMKYDIQPSEKTEVPLKFARTNLATAAANGIWLNWTPRKIEN